MPPLRPYATLYFEGYLMLGDSIIEPPPAFGVELILLDTLNAQIGLAYNREDIPYLGRIRRLSAFLCLPYNLPVHNKKRVCAG